MWLGRVGETGRGTDADWCRPYRSLDCQSEPQGPEKHLLKETAAQAPLETGISAPSGYMLLCKA